MNKSFKVVFSKARGALMAVNEATSSVQAKGTKTVIAVAVSLAAGAAVAAGSEDVTLEPVSSLVNANIGNATWEFDSDNPMNAYVQPGEDGKAVISDSSIENVTVTLKDTSGNPSAIGLSARGSADAEVTAEVTNSTFQKIHLSASGKVPNNNGPHGSAIATGYTSLTLNESHFIKNSAQSTNEQAQGGALYMSFGSIQAHDSEFVGNKVIANSENGEIGAFGGAAALFGVNGMLQNMTFTDNRAISKNDNKSSYSLGGALYLRSKRWGGTAGDPTKVSLISSSLKTNKALGYDGEGGAVYVKGDDDANFRMAFESQENEYEANEASNLGGAIYALGAAMTSTSDTFTGNKAKNGGAIYNDAALKDAATEALSMKSASFESNEATRDGGAVAISDLYANNAQTISISDSIFTGNHSARKGGAVVIYDMEGHQYSNVTMENVAFTDNYTAADEESGEDYVANSSGGAIYSESDLTIKGDSVFEGNAATTNGGAIYLGQTASATKQGNQALLTLIADEAKTIRFANNTANNKANDIYLSAGTASKFEGEGRIELMSGLAGAGTVTSSAASVYVEDVTGFTGSLTISGGVFEVNAGKFLDTDDYVFGDGASISTSGNGELKLGGVTKAGSINLTTGTIGSELNVSFEDAFLTGTVTNGVLDVASNTDFIEDSGLGEEVSANMRSLFARGATARESSILEQLSEQYVEAGEDGSNALTTEGVEAFRQATGGSVTAGAFNVAYDAQAQFTDSITRHQLGEHNGYGVWADVYYTSNEAKTLYGDSGYETDIYGGVVGFDATFSCGATAGIALTVGTGDTDTVGALKSSLDTDFYGVSLYTSKDFSGFDVKLDLGYMSFDNDFSGLGDAADVDAWTVGLRGDFNAYEGTLMNITPHIGLRYTHLKSDAVSFNDETSLNLLEAPVGVAFNGSFETNGWKIAPALDFSIIPQLGDTDVDTFAGTVDVIDNLYNTTLGVAATYQNMTVGLDYRYGFGNEERSNNSVNLKVRYRF